MGVIDKRLCKGTLSTSNATLYTVPANTKTIIKAITLCNKTSTAYTVTIKFASTEIIYQHTIYPNDTVTIPFIDQLIEATELIEGLASSNSAINYYISGKEIA